MAKRDGDAGTGTPKPVRTPDAPSDDDAPDPGPAPGGMPGGHLSVDPAQIASQAAALDSAAQRVRSQHGLLISGLNALGEFWGTDETGASFATNYLPSRDGITEGIDNVAEILSAMAEGLRQNAQGFGRTEDDASEGVRRLSASHQET